MLVNPYKKDKIRPLAINGDRGNGETTPLFSNIEDNRGNNRGNNNEQINRLSSLSSFLSAPSATKSAPIVISSAVSDADSDNSDSVVSRFLAAQENKMKNYIFNNRSERPGLLRWFFGHWLVRIILVLSGALLIVIGVFSIYVIDRSKSSQDEIVKSTDDTSSDSSSSSNVSPNIIFILADDMGWNSIGYKEFDLSFATPTLTNLAKNGIILDNFYAQEVCTPARASLLTGRYPLSNGMQYSIIMPTTSYGLDLDEILISNVLQDNGYATHIVGKWHLGHYTPRFLPTARGFDTYLGYVSGETFSWSKKNPEYTQFRDFIYSDKDCYYPYEDDDIHTYSTLLYKDKAIDIINEHDTSSSLFLFLSFQAVHDPFIDSKEFQNGLPTELLPDGMYDMIHTNVTGHKRRQYAMSLTMLDDAISEIYDTLSSKGILDNTIIVFASDNGGCYLAGGKNGPLRGTKGSLYEGGVKVDSFIYSPLLPSDSQGTIYTNLMHISDWFPTLLDLVDIEYTPDDDHKLDGVSHASNFINMTHISNVREYMLYNYFYDVDLFTFNMWTNGSFAVRNSQYKLMHTFESAAYSDWFEAEDKLDNDDSLAAGTCSQSLAQSGEFIYYLFDLLNDPYETINLYDVSGNDTIDSIKEELYAQLDVYAANSKTTTEDEKKRNKHCFVEWRNNNNYIVPWANVEELPEIGDDVKYPLNCYRKPSSRPTGHPTITSVPSTHKPTRYPTNTGDTTSPSTHKPTRYPTPVPSYQRTREPTEKKAPTNKPTGSKPTPEPKEGPTYKPTTSKPTKVAPMNVDRRKLPKLNYDLLY